VLTLVDALSGIFSSSAIVGYIMWGRAAGRLRGDRLHGGEVRGGNRLAALGGLIAEFYMVSALFVLVVFGGRSPGAIGVNLFRLLAS